MMSAVIVTVTATPTMTPATTTVAALAARRLVAPESAALVTPVHSNALLTHSLPYSAGIGNASADAIMDGMAGIATRTAGETVP